MGKEFTLTGHVSGIPAEITDEAFWDSIVCFIESRNWFFGGGLEKSGIDGCISSDDETLTAQDISQHFMKWAAANGWSFDCAVCEYADSD